MSLRPLVLFFNPRSGRYSKYEIQQLETQITGTLGNCKSISDPEELRKIRDSHIIVAGGDGTFHVAINFSDLKSNTYSVIPFGSGNDFVTNFDKSSVEDVLEHIAMQEVQKVDLLLINQVLAHNVAGLGFDAYIAKRAHHSIIKWASMKYIIPVLQHLFFYRPRKFQISTETLAANGKYFLISIGNGKRAGGGFRMFPEASVFDGKMDLLLIKPPTFFQKLRYAWLVNFGRHTHLKMVDYVQCEKVEINSDRELLFEADGDIYQARKITARVMSGVLNVIQ